MIPDIVTILSSAGVSALLSAGLIFLARNWLSERIKGAIKSEYDQKLESHKAQLRAQNYTALEHFKAELQIAASDRSIRLGQVFVRVVDTVEGTYSRLIAFHDAVGRYTSIFEYESDGTKEERRKIVADKYGEFLDYYRPRRPLLPKSTVKSIDEFRTQLHKYTIDFMWGVEKDGDSKKIQRGKEDPDTWSKTHTFMTEKMPGILENLDDDIRRLLGTNEGSNKSVQAGTTSGPV